MNVKVKHIHCPVNGWDCPYWNDEDHPCRCTIPDPMADCDDFAAFWDEDDDYIDDDWETDMEIKMTVWVIDWKDLGSAWSSFEEAEKFLMKEVKRHNWGISYVNRYDNGHVTYEIESMGETLPVTIIPYEVDVKPNIE